MVDTFVTFAQYELGVSIMFQLIYTCGMNTVYLWDLKAGSFVGCSAITVSRAGLDMVLREEIPPLSGIKPHSFNSWPAISQIRCCQLWVYVLEKY
jgi:hypothetical protein